METARWAVGALFALVGILWIISSVLGTVNYLFLGFGIVWLIGSVCWPLGILTHRRRQRAAEEKGQGQAMAQSVDPNVQDIQPTANNATPPVAPRASSTPT